MLLVSRARFSAATTQASAESWVATPPTIGRREHLLPSTTARAGVPAAATSCAHVCLLLWDHHGV